MKRAVFFIIAAFLVTGMVRNLQSVKSDDYHGQPKKIVVSEVPFDFGSDFRDSLARKMAECGVALAFFPVTDADARLQIRQTAVETETTYQPKYLKYASMIRYEFTLVDISTGKNVWKSQGDFVLRKPKEDSAEQQAALVERSNDWADQLVRQMRDDDVVGRCGSSVAVAPPVAPQPKPATVAAATAPVAIPGAAESSDAAPPSKAVPPMRFKIGNTVYNSAEEAEVALRADAARQVNELDLTPGEPHGGLLVVLAVEKPPQMAAAIPNGPPPEQLAQILAFSAMNTRIATDASLDALRKSGIFSEVQVVHSDDLAPDDFRGQPYKLYVPKETAGTKAHWALARRGGGETPLTVGPIASTVLQSAMRRWLDSLSAALNGLGG